VAFFLNNSGTRAECSPSCAVNQRDDPSGDHLQRAFAARLRGAEGTVHDITPGRSAADAPRARGRSETVPRGPGDSAFYRETQSDCAMSPRPGASRRLPGVAGVLLLAGARAVSAAPHSYLERLPEQEIIFSCA